MQRNADIFILQDRLSSFIFTKIMADKAASGSQLKTLEAGNIYFIYRPKVECESVASIDDVQQFYVILGPH